MDSVAILETKNLSRLFGDGQGLVNASITVMRGEKHALCGPSGSGKSTLIRCIAGLEQPDGGTLFIKGTEVAQGDRQARRGIGMVFQQFNLFPHLTVLQNVMLGPVRALGMRKSDARDRAMTYLERVRIPEQANKLPRTLSGGQQQRVAIARALAMQPEIMLFDEPTSSLDPEMTSEVLDVMKELAESGMTMVIITHEMGFVRNVADRVTYMEDGQSKATMTKDAFFDKSSNEQSRPFLERVLVH